MKTKHYIYKNLILFSVAPLIIFIAILHFVAWQEQSTDFENKLMLINNNAVQDIGKFIRERENLVQILSQSDMIKMFLAEQQKGDLATENEKLYINTIFQRIQENQEANLLQDEKEKIVFELNLIDKTGIIVASNITTNIKQKSPKFTELQQYNNNDNVYISNLLGDYNNKTSLLVFAKPVYYNDNYVGFIQLIIDKKNIEINTISNEYKTVKLLVFDKGSNFIKKSADNNNPVMKDVYEDNEADSELISKWFSVNKTEQSKGFLSYRNKNGQQLAYYSNIPNTSWAVVATADKQELIRLFEKRILLASLGVAIFCVCLALGGWILTQKITKPLQDFIEILGKVKAGDFSAKFSSKEGEFSEVAYIFNTLMEKINKDKHELLQRDECHRIIMESAQESIFEWDLEGDTVYRSGKITDKYHYQKIYDEDHKIIPPHTFFVHPDDRELYLNHTRDVLAGKTVPEIDIRARLNQSSEFNWYLLISKAVLNEKNEVSKVIVLLRDVDKLKKEVEELQFRAQVDLLTGLYNKVTTEKFIRKYLNNNARVGKHALIICDLDNFKKLNDTLGHAKGDRLLKGFTENLKLSFRKDDIVGRVGGDEFIIFLKNVKSNEAILSKIEAVQKALADYRDINSRQGEQVCIADISVSFGVAFSPEDGITFEELYEKADTALYLSKSRGKGRLTIFTQEKENDLT